MKPDAVQSVAPICSDCPPAGYPTDATRCEPCPRRPGASQEVKPAAGGSSVDKRYNPWPNVTNEEWLRKLARDTFGDHHMQRDTAVRLQNIADDIEHAQRERQQLRAGWRDIATAPRDGTQILLWFLGERVIGKWSENYRDWAGLNVKWHDGMQTISTMRDGMGNGGPTLWQPLPPPPEERADG